MWAQRLVAPERFERVKVPAPEASTLQPGELILRVSAGGICGSDLPFVAGGVRAGDTREWPRRPGFPMHEVVGVVVESADERFAPDSGVVGWAAGFDALSEYVVVRGDEVFVHDVQLAPEHAIALQPIACALYAVAQLGDVSGSDALILGQGSMGVLFTHVLRDAGARSVTGVDRIGRERVSRAMGADAFVWSSSEEYALEHESSTDVVVEAIGHQVTTLSDAVRASRVGGRISYFGIPDDEVYPLPMKTFLRKNLTLIAGVTRERAAMLGAAQAYARRYPRLIADFVTDVLPVSEVERAFAGARRPRADQLKTVLVAE